MHKKNLKRNRAELKLASSSLKSGSALMTDQQLPLVTPPCCPAWKQIEDDFKWFVFDEFRDFACIPCTSSGFRINYCPSCGASIPGDLVRAI